MAIKKVVTIIGSLRTDSSNRRLTQELENLARGVFEMSYYDGLSRLPHFNPDLDTEDPPREVVALRQEIAAADGVLICTPEYIFSLPANLKNALEWFVSTSLFSGKPVALITAAASGEKAHDELRLIMKTLEARFTKHTALLLKGIRSKLTDEGGLTETTIIVSLMQLTFAFGEQLDKWPS
jgi:chromate reductase, NAD(P)H dehydrogenase (quinone)